ncbi:hypothetical protein PLICRDRAFT_40309 [Plicaturopsis crispa FD-325 SS-3]|nr:hypothetical protein PLICRDRAFT_40309 [Plicaturopsis crispa FD-325 SS-3]
MSSRQNSRFSTLKVFKFASSSSSSNSSSNRKVDDAGPPPPPPPKDPYYLYNRSLTSLSPDSLSLPTTPLTPDYRRPSPAPSQSSMSLLSSAASVAPSVAPSTAETTVSSKKSFFKLGLGKRSPKPRSPAEMSYPPESADDENISLPWNFQHDLHVDEGFSGMPPSWTSRLAAAGFSEDEIAAIQARRNAARSPSSASGFPHSAYQSSISDLSHSPASGPVLARPSPRTSSLPRQYSEASLSSAYSRRGDAPPPVPLLPSQSRNPPVRKASDTYSESSSSSSMDGTNTSDAQYVYVDHAGNSVSHRAPATSSSDHSSRPVDKKCPQTPPRRQFRVVNESPRAMSPPPAYKSPVRASTFERSADDGDDGPGENTLDDESSVRDSRRLTAVPSRLILGEDKRLTAVPPRISLNEDSDLSSWSESLFSAIPSATFSVDSRSPDTPESAMGLPYERSSPTSPANPSPQSAAPRQSPGRLAPSKPVPSISVLQPRVELEPSPSTPLWKELMGMVKEPQSATASSPFSPEEPYTPALSDSGSPIVPFTPMLSSRGEFGKKVSSDTEREDSAHLSAEERERDANRDSGMSTVSTATVTAATIVTGASVATRAKANMVPSLKEAKPGPPRQPSPTPSAPRAASPAASSGSPHSSRFSDSSSSGPSRSGSGSGTSFTRSRENELQSPVSEIEIDIPSKSPGGAHLEPSPSPGRSTFSPIDSPSTTAKSPRDTFGSPTSPAVNGGAESDEGEGDVTLRRPSIIITETPNSPNTPSSSSGTPRRYRGWQSEVVAPLEEFIDYAVDPTERYVDLQEIAEGDSGSVFAARVVSPESLKLPSTGTTSSSSVVAIKNIAILPQGSPKLAEIQRELVLMKGIAHDNVLTMDALYVDLVEDSLWIRMELMERSLADVVGLVSEGLMVQERMIARFASDVLLALEYLQDQRIAHRDVRSDNLLLNAAGVLKIADFSNAVQLPPRNPTRTEPVGVIYWQAPEMRSGSYNALKVDVWSLGATVWEMAQAEPPFADLQDPRQFGERWPALSQPEIYSRSFHDFLRVCSHPSASRPHPRKILTSPFIQNACGRVVIVQLLTQCKNIEERMNRRDSTGS